MRRLQTTISECSSCNMIRDSLLVEDGKKSSSEAFKVNLVHLCDSVTVMPDLSLSCPRKDGPRLSLTSAGR